MSKRFFIAGTDTEVGKTHTSVTLLKMAAAQGLKGLGLKPVAAGADQWFEGGYQEGTYEFEGGREFEGGYENEDALALKRASNIILPIRQLNPFCLPEPLSPHIAASRVGAKLTVNSIVDALAPGLAVESDLTLVEGAGGWRVPISDTETMADLAKALDLPVILVVGMRLGCLNHAMLTAEAIVRDGLKLHGWIANTLQPDMPAFDENIATLERHLPCPKLLQVPFRQESNGDIPCVGTDINKLI